MSKEKIYERPVQIQLELPDYRYDYEQWLNKKKNEDEQEKKDTVIILDIY
jgi:hypothetical protein